MPSSAVFQFRIYYNADPDPGGWGQKKANTTFKKLYHESLITAILCNLLFKINSNIWLNLLLNNTVMNTGIYTNACKDIWLGIRTNDTDS